MTFLKWFFTGILLLLTLTPTYAKQTTARINVPFANITLNPNDIILGTYTFGQNPVIFCFENNLQSIGAVTWTYQGKRFSSTLSVTLVTNTNFQGFLADASGTITVRNNQPIPLIVSCLFAF